MYVRHIGYFIVGGGGGTEYGGGRNDPNKVGRKEK